ncbi:hypothetical protein FXW78_25630 [Rhodococcus opacus]|nr:hypothetical protein [Rhodococcus opacus]
MTFRAVVEDSDQAQARVFLTLLREEAETVSRRLEEAEILGYHARKHHRPARAARFRTEIADLPRVGRGAAARRRDRVPISRCPRARRTGTPLTTRVVPVCHPGNPTGHSLQLRRACCESGNGRAKARARAQL